MTSHKDFPGLKSKKYKLLREKAFFFLTLTSEKKNHSIEFLLQRPWGKGVTSKEENWVGRKVPRADQWVRSWPSSHNSPNTACWSWDSSSSFRHSPSMSHSSSKLSCSLRRGNSGGLSSFSFSPCGVPSEPTGYTEERVRKPLGFSLHLDFSQTKCTDH